MILNLKDLPEGVPDGAVFIGRPSILGNPFGHNARRTREQAISLYREWLWDQIRRGRISLRYLADLEGRDLVCYCAPKRCHGEVVQEAARWAAGTLCER